MKKIINDPSDFVPEMIEGLVAAHPNMITTADDHMTIVRTQAPIKNKVALVTGGGSGHLPVFLGYVGEGLLDGCAIGDVFSSPSAEQILDVTRRVHGDAGILYVYGNYGGDVMNFDMAAELAEMEGVKSRTVLVTDDVASAPKAEKERRRGVAGMVFAFKIAGAKAQSGGSLDEVADVTERALSNIATIGVALSSCTIPKVGKPSFSIGDNEMEIGMGIHGEPGIERETLKTADEIAGRMLETVLTDLSAKGDDQFAVMINGLGATPLEELYIIYRKVQRVLSDRKMTVHRAYVGEYATSMEMAGVSITLFRLDNELAKLLDAEANTPFFKQLKEDS